MCPTSPRAAESAAPRASWRPMTSSISSTRSNCCCARRDTRSHLAKSPGAGVERLWRSATTTRCLIDLNYTRDTTSGRKASICFRKSSSLDSNLPVIVMTAWGNVESGGRGHAPRRPRLHPEAVGERAAAGHLAHPGRIASRLAARRAAGS